MAAIRGYMASSLDGFIADETGGVDWLEPFNGNDYGYEAFMASVRTVVMGRKTYDQARGFDPNWVYDGKRSLIVTSAPLADPPPDTVAWTAGIAGLTAYLRALDDGDAWIVGGSALQSALLEQDALDTLDLFIMPVLLGGGVPLHASGTAPRSLELTSTVTYDLGVVRLSYRIP